MLSVNHFLKTGKEMFYNLQETTLSCTPFSVPLDEKVPEGAEPRFWEEEGFYVGKPPQVSPANLNIMENRMKEGNQTQWFGEDGQLKRLSSPLKEKPTRPPVINFEEIDPLLQTEWIKV